MENIYFIWNKFLAKFKKPVVTPMRYHIEDNHLSLIDVKKLGLSYSSDYSLYRVNSICENIVEYSKLLNKLIQSFKYGKELKVAEIPRDVKYIYLRDFYVNQNRFIDIEEHSLEFIRLAAEFIDIYRLHQNGEKDYVVEKNLLLASIVFSNIKALSKDLCL